MRIGVLGTGMVGHALASRLVETGHDVVMGSRDAANDKAAAWVASQPERAAAGTFASAAAHGEVVLNATGGAVSLDVLRLAGAENLAGKVLIDVSNPMKPDVGFPPQLDPVGDDSLAERIQREFPAARVVKTLNTMNCNVMADPSLVPGGARCVHGRRGRVGQGDRARPAGRLRLAGLLDSRPGRHRRRARPGDVPHLLDRPARQPRAQRV